MRALRPACELALAALAIVVVTLLARGVLHDAPPAASSAELRHDPRSCPVCLQPSTRPRLLPSFPEAELVSEAPQESHLQFASSRP